jgi:DNA topoisomerase-1
MANNALVIVESPAKANTIKKFLCKGFKVVASVGHVMDLPTNRLGVDLDNGFSPESVVSRGKKKILDQIKKDAKEADLVISGLIWIAKGRRSRGTSASTPVQRNVKRIIFNEITKGAIQSAIGDPTELDMMKVMRSRRAASSTAYGYKISPILCDLLLRVSAGRVQTRAASVCEREQEIEAFVPVEY